MNETNFGTDGEESIDNWDFGTDGSVAPDVSEDADAGDSGLLTGRRQLIRGFGAASVAVGALTLPGAAAADPPDHARNDEDNPGRGRGDDDEDEEEDDDDEDEEESEDEEDDDEEDEEESIGGEVEVEFTTQVTDGTYVVVDEFRLPEGGFMSIHDASTFVGEDGDVDVGPDSIIGYSEFLEAGEYEDFTVELFEHDEFEASRELEPSLAGQSRGIVALPHKDTNGNEEWDFYPGDTDEDQATAYDEGDPDKSPPDDRFTDLAAVTGVEDNPERFEGFKPR